MPRPKLQEEARRTETLAFRLTPAERLQIESARIAAGLPSASEYARLQALRGRVKIEHSRALDPAVFDELRRIGVNLNQLARIANTTGRPPARLDQAIAALETILLRELGDVAPPPPPGAPVPSPPGPRHGA